jgi:hypothetical protein
LTDEADCTEYVEQLDSKTSFPLAALEGDWEHKTVNQWVHSDMDPADNRMAAELYCRTAAGWALPLMAEAAADLFDTFWVPHMKVHST